MKNIVLLPLFILGLTLLSCQKELKDQGSLHESPNTELSLRSITNPDDPNLDAAWDFYSPTVTKGLIYYGQRIDGEPVKSIEVDLPWFTAGNPINNEDGDYKPELGWVLYLKDFGTPERPAQNPYFALYNKYSGVVRFFVYNYRVRNQGEASKTYYIGELGFNSTSNHNSSLAFFAPMNQFTKNAIDPNNKQIVLTQKGASDTWLNFDFTMTYDPKPEELRLNIYGVNETEINLGSDFSTLTARSSVGASGTSTSGFAEAMANGYEYASSTKSFLEAIKTFNDSLEKKNSSNRPLKASNLNTPLNEPPVTARLEPISTAIAALGIIQSALGLVKSFTGEKKSATATQTVIQYSGMVNTTGLAINSNSIYNIQFHQDPTAPLTANRYRPLYSGKVGLLGTPENLNLIAREFKYQCADNDKTKSLEFLNWNTGFRYDRIIDGLLTIRN